MPTSHFGITPSALSETSRIDLIYAIQSFAVSPVEVLKVENRFKKLFNKWD